MKKGLCRAFQKVIIGMKPFSEFGLASMVLSHAYVRKSKTYFVKIGHFHGRRFNIQDQLKGKVAGCGVSSPLYYGGYRNEQLKLVQALATVQLDNENTNATLSSRNNISALESIDISLSSSSMTDEQKNLQNIVKIHFIEKIILDGVCLSTFSDMIDSSKLKEGITQLFDALSE